MALANVTRFLAGRVCRYYLKTIFIDTIVVNITIDDPSTITEILLKPSGTFDEGYLRMESTSDWSHNVIFLNQSVDLNDMNPRDKPASADLSCTYNVCIHNQLLYKILQVVVVIHMQ